MSVASAVALMCERSLASRNRERQLKVNVVADFLGLHGPLAVVAIIVIALGAMAVFGSIRGGE